MGRRVEIFRPVSKKAVTVFTCGPSVYQRSHIGNFRTFLFEDVLVRYLEYSGYAVIRGMNFTDLEDKAIREALTKKVTMRDLTRANMRSFLSEMKLLRMKVPDYLPVASEHVAEMALIIGQLVREGHAYWYKGNVYYDPLTFEGFGKLYGLNMTSWPKNKRRFHRDTYPGTQWNMGDFILWHGHRPGDPFFRETPIGAGRPSWNVQDPALVGLYFDETLSIYCGGIDNLVRHHDYSISILEAVKPYPMARFWLHCHHVVVKGRKMSKSRGNIHYTDTLSDLGYTPEEIRFFLIYGHYRKQLSYSDRAMRQTAQRLRALKIILNKIKKKAGRADGEAGAVSKALLGIFARHMDDDLDVRAAFDGLHKRLSDIDIDPMTKEEASGIIDALKKIDLVLRVLF